MVTSSPIMTVSPTRLVRINILVILCTCDDPIKCSGTGNYTDDSRRLRARPGICSGRRPIAEDHLAVLMPHGDRGNPAETIERTVDAADAKGSAHLLSGGAWIGDDDALARVAAEIADEIRQWLALSLEHPLTPADDLRCNDGMHVGNEAHWRILDLLAGGQAPAPGGRRADTVIQSLDGYRTADDADTDVTVCHLVDIEARPKHLHLAVRKQDAEGAAGVVNDLEIGLTVNEAHPAIVRVAHPLELRLSVEADDAPIGEHHVTDLARSGLIGLRDVPFATESRPSNSNQQESGRYAARPRGCRHEPAAR